MTAKNTTPAPATAKVVDPAIAEKAKAAAAAKALADKEAKAKAAAQAKAEKEKAAELAKAEKEAERAQIKLMKEQAAASDKEAKAAAAVAAKQAREAAAAAKAAKKEADKANAKAAKEQSRQPEQNGIRRPKPDGICGQAWAAFDKLSHKKGSPVAISEALGQLSGVAEATVRTQYARWRKFHNVSGRVAPAPEKVSVSKRTTVKNSPERRSGEKNYKGGAASVKQ